jgi:hypothetical protein
MTFLHPLLKPSQPVKIFSVRKSTSGENGLKIPFVNDS